FGGSMDLAAHKTVPFPKGASYEEVAALLAELAADLTKELGGGTELIEVIGVAVAGSVDPKGEMVIHAPNLGFRNAPLRQAVQEHFPGIPVYMENDAYAALLAEYHLGALKGCGTGILLTLGTGVGTGLVMGGSPFLGGMGRGTEAGHMVLDYQGGDCNCGRQGCLETLCSASWLIRAGQELVKKEDGGLLSEKTGGDPQQVTAKMVIDCAQAGDPIALDIFNAYIEQLGCAIVSLVNLLDPEKVVLGGGVSQAGDFLFAPLRKFVEENSFFHYAYPIVPAQAGTHAGTTGAALLFQDKQL
ncbi:MAG: ROK family protein, partial [Firmicutes bacterium]|nr:ROK family protein [Bacillota bacterium]